MMGLSAVKKETEPFKRAGSDPVCHNPVLVAVWRIFYCLYPASGGNVASLRLLPVRLSDTL